MTFSRRAKIGTGFLLIIALLFGVLISVQPAKVETQSQREPGMVMADDIPVANTPPGGYGNSFPPPVLATCTEPLVNGAPDLRGIWKTASAKRGGKPAASDDPILHYVERIEQCGNRIVDMGGGTIADARADGTAENGVHDVSVFDYKTPIRVIASYEGNHFALRPLIIPHVNLTLPGLIVTRRLNPDRTLLWTRPDRGGMEVLLRRIGGPNDPYTRTDLRTSKTGGRR